jgi:RNA polymerase sigma-70 factor (ECF subfamily)
LDVTHDDAGDLGSLLAAASSGDESAWRELIGRYGRRVYALARSRCRRDDLAEEVTQSVFVTVAHKLSGGEYAEQGRFESWLFRIAMNRIRDEIRRQTRHAQPTDPATLGTIEFNQTPNTTDDGQLQQLREALDALPAPDREVIELRHHGSMSFLQMSQLLGEPMGTLLARHHRALRKLKDLMTARTDTPGVTP